MDDNKIFDVTPPKTPESIAAAKNARKIMLDAPQLKQSTSVSPELEQNTPEPVKPTVHHSELTIERPEEKDASKATEAVVEEVVKVDSEPEPIKTEPETAQLNAVVDEKTAEPITPEPQPEPSQDDEKPVEDAPQEKEKPDDTVKESNEDTPQLEKTETDDSPTEQEEKDEPIKQSASVDSILPDDSQRAASTAKDAMQSPTMYDTKAYYVPIGNSQHRHGHLGGAIIAGLITAALAIGAVLVVVKFL
jgi:hypothetical protein